MRSTHERIVAVERRIKELQRQKEKWKRRRMVLSVAVSLLVVIGMGLSMPGIMEQLSEGDYTSTGMMASTFYDGDALGYVLVGLLAFALGVCLTVLSFFMSRRSRREKEYDNDDRYN